MRHPSILLPTAIMVSALAGAAALPSVAAEAAGAAGVLQRVGTLDCTANLEDQPALPPTMGLSCRLRMQTEAKEPISINGTMVGADLYVRDPGKFPLTFAVLAPEARIGRENVGGDYDITTSHPYELARTANDVLFGGEGDRLALQLQTNDRTRISPSTRLTLTLVRPNS